MLPIECIAHRGFWTEPAQANSRESFERAFRAGYGVETDLRDHRGQIVISHDPPGDLSPPELTLDDFLTLYRDEDGRGTLALNIKADGLAKDAKQLLDLHGIEQYFVFDMSIPDMLSYARLGMKCFARQSELETPSILNADSPISVAATQGIWLDSFSPIWYSPDLVLDHLASGLDVCLVSPELHRRKHSAWWDEIKAFFGRAEPYLARSIGNLMLCTDYPDQFTANL